MSFVENMLTANTQPTINLEECLKLLRSERDEQRLVGLLLVTKVCTGDDHDSIKKVYDVGATFLNRLLNTGLGKMTIDTKNAENQMAYLQLSITVLAAICRVPEIASTKDMVDKVPLVLEILSKGYGLSSFDECYEFLVLVSNASEDGVSMLSECGVVAVLASHMSSLADGSQSLELAMRLVQLMLSKDTLNVLDNENSSKLSLIVAVISKQFAISHDALKFELLHLLSSILSSNYAESLHNALRLISNDNWATYIRVGVTAVLQNRVASAHRLQALYLVESMIAIKGEEWLIDLRTLPYETSSTPVDRCLLLVLESSRVEVAVCLNELAYARAEALNNSSTMDETVLLRQHDLGIVYSLIEKIVKLISDEGRPISEGTLMKIISGLNETIDVVLDFLQDAKDQGQTRGVDLLAAVRIVGSYLSDAPSASINKVQGLLEYILTIKGADESSPFYSICFFLPYLCQVTEELEWCRVLASYGGHKVILSCLVKLIHLNKTKVGDLSSILMACSTILNVLVKRVEIGVQLDVSDFIPLLTAFALSTEYIHDPSFMMMASSICSLIFDLTSEEALLGYLTFNLKTLHSLSHLISQSLKIKPQEGMFYGANAEKDLHHIFNTGYARWVHRFPIICQRLQS